MVNGIYTAASGMLLQNRKLEVTSNNLSNTNTTGFKRDIVSVDNFRAQSTTLEESDWRTTLFNETLNNTHNIPQISVDHSQGHVRHTENPYDVAINGNGFLAVHTPNGERYVRSGELQLDQDGQLVTKEGFLVKTAEGEGADAGITITEPAKLHIALDGSVYDDGALAGQLKVVQFDSARDLRKIGFNQYENISPEAPPQPAQNFEVRQGYLEASNVNIVSEMVEMVQINRSFGAYQKMITSIDQSMAQLLQASKTA